MIMITIYMGREREREREREKKREREQERERDSKRETESKRETDSEAKRRDKWMSTGIELGYIRIKSQIDWWNKESEYGDTGKWSKKNWNDDDRRCREGKEWNLKICIIIEEQV